MAGHLMLLLGIASIGVTLGYMVGGSATPAVSVAVPAIFGLVLTAIALIQATAPDTKFLQSLIELGDKAAQIPEISEYRTRSRAASVRVGVALIVFSVSYLTAATLGAHVRINDYLVR